MKKKGKLQYLLFVLGLAVFLLTGCSETETTATKKYRPTKEELSYALPQIGEARILTMEMEKGAKGTLTVATVGSPNVEILQEAARILEKKGYLLKIEMCQDYLSPNRLVSEGKANCNYYQHEAFLERYNLEHQTALLELTKIHYEPMAIFSEQIKNIDQIPEGARVLVPENPTALAQALFLLQSQGLLTLMQDADLTAMKDDILENPLKLEIITVPEEEIILKFQESDLVICHKSYVRKEGREAEHILLAEESKDSLAAQSLSQGIVVSDISNENANLLAEVLRTKEIQQFVESYYGNMLYMMNEK